MPRLRQLLPTGSTATLLLLASLGFLLLPLPHAWAKKAGVFWQGLRGENSKIIWSRDDLRVFSRGKQTYSAWLEAKDDWTKQKQALEAVDAATGVKLPTGYQVTRSIRLLSWVGAYLSFEQTDQTPTSTQVHWRVVDIRHPEKPVSLTDLFEDPIILRALSQDKLIRKALISNLHVAEIPQSSDELVSWLAEGDPRRDACAYRFPADLLSRFAFHHLNSHQVIVYLQLPPRSAACKESLGPSSDTPSELRLSLPTNIYRKFWFELTEADPAQTQHPGAGILLKQAEALQDETGQVFKTTFSFSPGSEL